MAGWVCQTRKMLSTVISSLADDLEQTVEDFNDAIYRFSSSSENISTAEHEMSERLSEITDNEELVPDKEHLLSSAMQTPRLHQKNQTCVVIESYVVATTRQPETWGFPSALNTRLSQSSPALQITGRCIPEHVDVDQISHQRAVAANSQSPGMRSSYSMLSVSSPCLTSTQFPEETASDISHLGPASPKPHFMTWESSKSERLSLSKHTCPCHNRDSLHKFTHSLSMKHPGKVVRASTTAMEGHNIMTSQDVPSGTTKQIPKANTDLEQADAGTVEPDNAALATRKSSTRLALKREKNILRWATLRPLRYMLSFAFNQLANVLLLLTEESRNTQTLTSHEILSVKDARHTVNASETSAESHEQGLLRQLSESNDADPDGHDVLCSSFPGRTYSAESFEIIETSCFDFLPRELRINHNKVSEHYEIREPETHISVSTKCFEFPNGNFNSEHQSKASGHMTEPMSSSAELVSFDFGKLVSNRQVDKLNPIRQNFHLGSESLGEDDMNNSYVVVQNSGPNMFVSEANDGIEVYKSGCHIQNDGDNENDDDGDSSVSFIILSDKDDDDEFICF